MGGCPKARSIFRWYYISLVIFVLPVDVVQMSFVTADVMEFRCSSAMSLISSPLVAVFFVDRYLFDGVRACNKMGPPLPEDPGSENEMFEP